VSLDQTAETAADLAQVLAVVVGGSWAFMHFMRGRTFAQRAELLAEAQLTRAAGGQPDLLRVSVEFRNLGLSRITLASDECLISTYVARKRGWSTGHNLPWSAEPVLTTPLFDRETAVDANDVLHEELLIPAATQALSEALLAYRLDANVQGERRWFSAGKQWSNAVVVPAQPEG
jgi:hypothetical protein